MSLQEVEVVNHQYGKDFVRLLHLRRDGDVHYIKELEVCTRLSHQDGGDFYRSGDNTEVVATDSQKNTVYILAKQNGIQSIELFAQQLYTHFLTKYSHVDRVTVSIEEKPWKRMQSGSKDHVHSFMATAEGTKFCRAEKTRTGTARFWAGIKDVKVMKTTKSSFENFMSDEYRTLPDAADRVMCTVIQTEWEYRTLPADCESAWSTARQAILDAFSGPPDTGVHSPSAQQTLYIACQLVLSKVPEIEEITITLPNIHSYEFDMSKFVGFNFGENGQVFQPTDKPAGNIQGTLRRTRKAHL